MTDTDWEDFEEWEHEVTDDSHTVKIFSDDMMGLRLDAAINQRDIEHTPC